MSKCCGGASCACLIEAGAHAEVTGSGSSQDPFVIVGDVDLEVTDNSVFNLTLTGGGTIVSPWNLQVAFAGTASLNDLPDVDLTGAILGDVLGYDGTDWVPVAPTTIAPGAITTDDSLDGDGSVGDPLLVLHDADRFTDTTATGIGLNDAGINRLNRKFGDTSARGLASPAPDLNTLSMLDSAPGQVDYWTGSQWLPIIGAFDLDVVGELLVMSGGYTSGPITVMIRQINVVTNVDGTFDAFSVADLTGAAGVLSAVFQPTGALSFSAVLNGDTNKIEGTAYQLLDGSVYGSQAISGTAIAWVY